MNNYYYSSRTANKRAVGTLYEQIAFEFLEKEGMRVIVRNYRVRIGEIDIICRDGEYWVFVEVKYRRSMDQGGASYAISYKKQQIIRRVAEWFIKERHIPSDALCRFDAVLIDGEKVTHIKQAW